MFNGQNRLSAIAELKAGFRENDHSLDIKQLRPRDVHGNKGVYFLKIKSLGVVTRDNSKYPLQYVGFHFC